MYGATSSVHAAAAAAAAAAFWEDVLEGIELRPD
jgi:hypothetical protein